MHAKKPADNSKDNTKTNQSKGVNFSSLNIVLFLTALNPLLSILLDNSALLTIAPEIVGEIK